MVQQSPCVEILNFLHTTKFNNFKQQTPDSLVWGWMATFNLCLYYSLQPCVLTVLVRLSPHFCLQVLSILAKVIHPP